MDSVFISYSTNDKYFAELLEAKLQAQDIGVWRDVGSIKAGEEWRVSIDKGIADCAAVILAMSPASCSSHYVTYEWARALGMAKPIVPVLLQECVRHPKIEPIQYIDFRNHNESTWQQVIQRIQETLKSSEKIDSTESNEGVVKQVYDALTDQELKVAYSIRGYLEETGFRMMSFDRVRQKFGKQITNKFLSGLVSKSEVFAGATIKGGKPGLRLL